jgi:sulfite reductase (NADPH) flavoprotein alpha-component
MTEASTHIYTRNHPFLASIKERYSLCKPGSKKNTQHIVVDLHDSGICYVVGDSIGIYPLHESILVEKTLKAMKATGKETVLDKHAEKEWLLHDFLTSQANITEISRKLLGEIFHRQTHPQKKAFLETLHAEGNKEALKEYLNTHHLWDTLHEHEEVIFTPQELCNLLMPLLPRLYSIASSQKIVGNEVHLTVAYLEYESNGHARQGVCTNYLCHLAPLNQKILPIYIQPHHGFTLPKETNVPIIMIGPGTGVAPFRAFMQERAQGNDSNKNWLFFGEWNKASDFFYESFWQELAASGKMRLEVAFSRDQDYKIYVQHRMQEHGEELFRWLESGAYFYVCGDAHYMAKDVEAALLQIIQHHGKMDEPASKLYLKKLRTEKRYLRDVY